MATYDYIYTSMYSLLRAVHEDLTRYPLAKIENRATGKVVISVFTAAVSDCVDNLGQCVADDPERQAYSDSDGIDGELVATALRDGGPIDAGDLTYSRVDIQQLVDWLDAHDGNDDTPAGLYDDIPDASVWRQVARLSDPTSDFIEYLEELANL